MASAYLGIGGNLGDRLGHLVEAVRRLHRSPDTCVEATSSVYESTAVGFTAQPDFLNLVLRVATALSPHELLAQCLRIETELGRVRRERWGPRIVDVDVLLYEGITLEEALLTIPHPRMQERSFVLTPLAEIAPDLTLGGESVRAHAAKLDQTGLRKIAPLEWAVPKQEASNHADPGN